MTTLTFSKGTSGLYEVEVSVSKNFNLHIETASTQADRIDIAVTTSTTSTGNKMPVLSKYFNKVYDHDFEAKVYPKKILISCTSLPSVAQLTEAS